jgi:cytoskeletal protein RodZ
MATPSFGEKLKRERECRDTSIEEIAEQTKIALRFLQALEKDQFDELPGRAFGKFYIRAYAEVLKFDPEPWIVEYDREQAAANGASTEAAPAEPSKPRRVEAEIARWREARRAAEQAPTEVAEECEPVETPDGEPSREVDEETPVGHLIERSDASVADIEEAGPVPVFDREDEAGGARYDEAAALASILGTHEATRGAWRRWRNIFAVVLSVGLVVVFTWVVVSLSGSSDGTAEAEPSSVDREASPLSEADTNQARGGETVLPEPESISTKQPTAPTPESPAQSIADSTAASAGITVSEFGVGRRIVNRRLEDRGRSFEEGSVVLFQTRVVGGSPGENIRHVWLRDGRAVQTVDLALGGTHWRTHSRKTLWGTGEWTVEARDPDGTVLARASFVCVPASP